MKLFFVPWEVKPKGNSKQIVRGKDGRSYLIEPAKNRQNAKDLRTLFAEFAPPTPYHGPVVVTYTIMYPFRGYHNKKQKSGGMIPKHTRPDLGQLVKQLDDALQAAGFLYDDAQICSYGNTRKVHCSTPGVSVEIREWEEFYP